MVYGYLIPYAENKKIDMGGAHWCMQLIHIHLMLLVYIIMMTGIGLHRAESKLPGFITACSFVWWLVSYRKYKKTMHWETLPYMKLLTPWADTRPGETYEAIDDRKPQGNQEQLKYCQPELEYFAKDVPPAARFRQK